MRFMFCRKIALTMLQPFNFAIPFNYSQIHTPRGAFHPVLPRGLTLIEYNEKGLPKSAIDPESPCFMPFFGISTPEKAFPIVSKSAGT